MLASNLTEVVAIFIATLAGVRLFAPIHILLSVQEFFAAVGLAIIIIPVVEAVKLLKRLYHKS